MFIIGFGVGVILGCLATMIFLAISKEVVRDRESEGNVCVLIKQYHNRSKVREHPPSSVSH